MKKCFGKTHSVFKLLLILWMASLIHIAVGDLFYCSGSNMNVSMTLVCDGIYDCDNYEDESSCNSAAYLEEGEPHFISFSYTTTTRLYKASILQTNATNGFRVVFRDLDLNNGVQVQLGIGNDPSDIQSGVTTIHGLIQYEPDDVHVDTNEMWFAVIGANRNSWLRMDVEIISLDLSNFFYCSGSNMNVSMTLVCDGYYDCDNYEDESSCNSATLQEGESHFFSLPSTSTTRLYYAILLKTNATNGFRVVFRDVYLSFYGDEVQIGTGNDPSDIQSCITTIHGNINNDPHDVYVDTNEMWFALIGTNSNSLGRMDVEIISIDLSTSFVCSSSNMRVSPNNLCDGLYQCDHYEDESACNSATLQEGESHFFFLPHTTTKRFYNAILLKTNAMNGFRVVFRDILLQYYGNKVQIGTGNDTSDIQSVITTIDGYVNYEPDDVYIDTSEMWFAAIGANGDSRLLMDVEIISIDLSTSFACSSSNMNVSPTAICDGIYQCYHFEDELACNYSATYLQDGESHVFSIPYTTKTRFYYAVLLKTNATNGFRVVFRYLYLKLNGDQVQIGTGNDPSDIRSGIKTFHRDIDYEPYDVYVDTNEMWFAVIGADRVSRLRMAVEIISIDISTDCGSIFCQNSGTCVSSELCECVTGLTGTMCEININDCLPNPCMNGGSCTDGIDSFGCSCVASYTGSMCQTVSTPSSSPSVSSPLKSNSTVIGSAVGAIVVIVIVIVLIIIFYKRRSFSNESASTKSRGKESDSSPQYENPVFDQSQTDVHTFQDHTYHDLNSDAQGYEIPTGPHPYKDINTDDQGYDDIADPHTYIDFNTVAQGYDDIADPNTNQDLNTDAQGYNDFADPHTYQDINTVAQGYNNIADPHTYLDLNSDA